MSRARTAQPARSRVTGAPAQAEADRGRQLSPRAATIAIALTGVAYAHASFFARRLTEHGLAPTSVAFARFALIALVLLPNLRSAWGSARSRRRWSALDRERRAASIWGLLSGAAMALGWVAYVDGVERGDVALAGVAYMTYPFFTLVALALVFGRRLTSGQVIGAGLVLVGAAVALSADATGGGLPIVTFAAPATFGFATAVLTERLLPLTSAERLAAVGVGAATALAPFLAGLPGNEVIPADASTWLAVIGLGFGAALVPMLVYSAAAPVVGAARSSVAGATELPAVLLVGVLYLGEQITSRHLLAAACIVVAIVVTPTTRASHVLPDRGEPAPPPPRCRPDRR